MMNLQINTSRRSTLPIEDWEFDALYPVEIAALSAVHWTPVSVAHRVAMWLASERGVTVLDIGSGPGKFCLAGADITQGIFTGIEQRANLVALARSLAKSHGINNATFIQADVRALPFHYYDAFYLYNPFGENMLPISLIDNDHPPSLRRYRECVNYVRSELASLPNGTRVATYHGSCVQESLGYYLEAMECGGSLKLWVKGTCKTRRPYRKWLPRRN